MSMDDVDDDFLSQVASLEAHALLLSSSKRRKLATSSPSHSPANATSSLSPVPAEKEGVYTAALRGSRSLVFRHISDPAPKPSSGGGGGGGGECFKCGKSGHWARDCGSGGSGGGGGGSGDVAEKACPCGVGVCAVLTANTEKNRGRKFYKCPLREENGGCGFFEWCDKIAEVDTITVKSQSYATNTLASDLSCPCGAGACLILTAKTGKNIGQQFYRCPANQTKSCGFFKWCNEHKTSGDTLSFSANASTTYKTITPSQNSFPKDNGSSCFKCGKDGHWARDCSFSANSSTTYTTGKTNQKNFANNSGSSCFKCGQEGHWAKDCS